MSHATSIHTRIITRINTTRKVNSKKTQPHFHSFLKPSSIYTSPRCARMKLVLICITLFTLAISVHSQIVSCMNPVSLDGSTLTYRDSVIDALFNASIDSYPYSNECLNFTVVAIQLDTHMDEYCQYRWSNVSSLISACVLPASTDICYDQIPGPECACFGLKSQISCIMISISNWNNASKK